MWCAKNSARLAGISSDPAGTGFWHPTGRDGGEPILAKTLLGEGFAGIACSDRWWAYNYLSPGCRQVCWSHLIRDFTAQREGLESEQSFGQAGLEIAGRLFQAGTTSDKTATGPSCSSGSRRSSPS